MYWKLVTDATSEPITAAQVKTHCGITISSDDTYLGILIKTARQKVENDSDRALLTQTWKLYLDDFPASNDTPIRLPRSPLITVSSIIYTNTAGTPTTWTSTEYDQDLYVEPARILPAYGYTWPSSRGDPSNVIVEYTCGYGADIAAATLLPNGALLAIYMLVAHWYDNREAILKGITSKAVEIGYDSLIDNIKVGWEW